VITVTKLTKVYTDHDKKSLTALKNISFKLPDKGLIFITGKSGSGKSTLLNMLGGLDNITRGDIIADGNRLSEFTPADYDRYRNSYIGFIFQDYCLLDDLTIQQNIELVLDLNHQQDKSIIKHILDKVHLPNCENRYPRELSGGQKQRVAIARALVKDPYLILADEPTGNLDSKTAKQIMKILKDLSKTRLVVVVSHNLEDAEEYGDRIIELADGEIIRDEQKMEGYEDKLELINGKMILPHFKEITQEEIDMMNTWQKKGQIYEYEQRQDGFYPTNNEVIVSNKIVKTEKSKLSFGKSIKLAGLFLKRRRLSFLLTSLIITCIVAVLGICQFFVAFDYHQAINDAVVSEGQDVLVAYKSKYINEDFDLYNTTFIFDISDNDIKAFDETEYDSDYYRLYNDALHISGASQLLRQEIRLYAETNLKNFYLLESYGTLSCSEQYLKNIFGNGDNVEYYGNPIEKSYGIIITDYVADSMIYHSNGKYETYDDLLGLFYENSNDYSHYINAIIETNYEQKFSAFKDKLMNEYSTKVLLDKNTDIYEGKQFLEFSNYVEKYLGLSYTFNNNYIADSITVNAKNFVRVDYSYVGSEGIESPHYFDSLLGYLDTDNSYIDIELDTSEIALSVKSYNAIFNTDYDNTNIDSYAGDSIIEISKFSRFKNNNDTSKITKTLKVKKLFDSNSNIVIFDQTDFLDFRSVEVINHALYFDDVSNISYVYHAVSDNAFIMDSIAFNSLGGVIDVVKVFEDFFKIINIGLYFACLLLLMNFGAGNIRKRKYEIGVIKAIGGQTKELGKIFVVQVVSVGIIVCLLSSVVVYLLSGLVNSVLSDAMLYFIKNETLSNLSIIQFNPIVLCLDILMILGITFVSSFIQLYSLHKIKPINIIKHKN